MNSRVVSFDRWKARWVIDAGDNKYLYDRKIYTWDELVEKYNKMIATDIIEQANDIHLKGGEQASYISIDNDGK
jgi:hypothetical protein